MLPYGVRTGLLRVRSGIERAARRTLYGSRPTWKRRPNLLPWFDRPDALGGLDGDADRELLEHWVRDGYVVVDDVVDREDIDRMVAVLDGLWDAAEPIVNLTLLGLREDADAEPRDVSHADLLRLERAHRHRIRDVSDWRIHGFHYVNEAAHRIYWNPRLRVLANRIFGRRARPIAAINFMTGSQQALHQDMAVFHIYPHNYLLGAWIACEDIAPESGPLVFYPGSHRAPFFPGFTDYPQTNLRTADRPTARAYQDYVDGIARRFERREFRARKGQVLFWHGMLIHGGAAVARRGVSRKSMVIHYAVRGADVAREVRGPFNW